MFYLHFSMHGSPAQNIFTYIYIKINSGTAQVTISNNSLGSKKNNVSDKTDMNVTKYMNLEHVAIYYMDLFNQK